MTRTDGKVVQPVKEELDDPCVLLSIFMICILELISPIVKLISDSAC